MTPPYALCQSPISEVIEFIQLPGSQARGAVCMETFLETEGLSLNHSDDDGAPSETENHRILIR